MRLKSEKKWLQSSKTGKKERKPRSRRGCVTVKKGNKQEELEPNMERRGRNGAAGPQIGEVG